MKVRVSLHLGSDMIILMTLSLEQTHWLLCTVMSQKQKRHAGKMLTMNISIEAGMAVSVHWCVRRLNMLALTSADYVHNCCSFTQFIHFWLVDEIESF